MKKKQPSEILMPALPRNLKIKKESRIKIEKELERRIFLIYTFSKRIMRDALSGISKKLKKEMLLYFKIFFLSTRAPPWSFLGLQPKYIAEFSKKKTSDKSQRALTENFQQEHSGGHPRSREELQRKNESNRMERKRRILCLDKAKE